MKNKFRGRPLVELPEDVIEADFLCESFGEELFEEYNRRVLSLKVGSSYLSVLKYERRRIVGSSPLAVILVNDLLAQEGLITAKQRDLELILRTRALYLRGTYEDTGLVLRSEDNPNEYLAGDLARQLRERNPEFKYPILFNLTDLKLRVDEDSPYGLAFDLTEGAVPLYAPILNSPNGSRFNSADIDCSTGLPRQVGKQGERRLRTIDSGLSRLYLDRNLDLGSSNGGLADSISGGRVVVVKVASLPKNS